MIPQILSRITSNKHTSIAGAVYAGLSVIGHISATWWPTHTAQITDTVKTLKEFCVVYGLALSGEIKPNGLNGTNGTTPQTDPPKP